MKTISKTLACLSVAGAAIASVPAAAQVNGIATSSPEAVIVRSQARINAYQQIGQTYTTQLTQMNTLRQEINTQQRSLDTDNNGQLTEAEIQANPTAVQQIQQKEQQVQQLSQPIAMAQTYVIEQLINDYNNARNQVISDKGIQIMLAPDAIQYAPDGVNVTTDLVNALNTRLPAVQTTPPAGWQPRRDSLQTHQAIQQILLAAAQQAAAQQQQAAQQPAAQPNQQPTGR
ncbi:OmpH family outer membrane protein [Erythrobacter sp. W53]|uniref:OmpH family outer membrane protein n=1 Tax=Erythrobacter sp. W53 TaxID=3425947 RepID=UPI003D7673C8